MSLSQVDYINEVADAGSVRSIVVVAEDCKLLADAHSGLCYVRDEVVGYTVRQLADECRRVSTDWVEVAQNDTLDVGTAVDVVGNDLLVDLLGIAGQQQEILARNGENQRLRQNLAGLEEKARVLADRRTQLEQTLALLVKEQDEVNESLCTARKSAENLQDESTAELEASIRGIEETNRKVRANLEKSRAEDEAARYASDFDKLTEAITQKRADRMALLNGADLPLPELSVEDGALTYKGKHWRDMSGSDQLRVAAAIVRRLNPDCGFVLLDKLEQMDMTTLTEFGRWLEAEHLQAIATRVSTGSECQIIIEDGMVKDAEPPVTEKPQPRSWTKGAF